MESFSLNPKNYGDNVCMTTISAKVIADSISPEGIRLITFQLRYPRFIHQEFLTHRQFSRNSSSSRAKPLSRWVDEIKKDCAMPIHWGKNQPGMQASEELDNREKAICKNKWLVLADEVITRAYEFDDYELHKQVVNRILEPFQHIDVVVTATEWQNFFDLRFNKDAQPEMYELARVMLYTVLESKPKELYPGSWHTPYISDKELENWDGLLDPCLVSAARCARVSYSNHDGSMCNPIKDVELAKRLLESGHMSPFEHQGTPIDREPLHQTDWWNVYGITHMDRNMNLWSGNFKGWVQYRQVL